MRKYKSTVQSWKNSMAAMTVELYCDLNFQLCEKVCKYCQLSETVCKFRQEMSLKDNFFVRVTRKGAPQTLQPIKTYR